MNHGTNTKRRPTLVYLAESISISVVSKLWQGVLKRTKEIGADLICYMGGGVSEDSASFIFNLINPNKIDGIISWNINIKEYRDKKYLSYYDKLSKVPIITLSVPISDFPVVMVDSYQGMREIVEHLIKVHGYTKIALVRGPKEHIYAKQRYKAFVDVVQENNIYDKNLITPYFSWAPSSGMESVRILLDERNLVPGKDIEAIVFISDNHANSAFDELTRRKIKIPEQLAITGYNATEEARNKICPITNVIMPFFEQSSMAVDLLLKLINNETIPTKTVLPSQLLIGQSCGCKSPGVITAFADTKTLNRKRGSKALSKEVVIEDIIAEISTYAQNIEIDKSILIENSKNMLIAFFNEIERNKQGEFLNQCYNFIRNLVDEELENGFLQDIISIFRRGLFVYTESTGVLFAAENLWTQARVLISEVLSRIKSNQGFVKSRQEQTLRDISVRIITNLNLNTLMNILVESLPQLGIPGCYICLYENAKSIESLFEPPENSRLILAYENGKRREIDGDGIIFPSKNLLPEGFSENKKQKTLIVNSLNSHNMQIGFVLFEVGPDDGFIYFVLNNLLSSAIMGAFLLDETIQKSEKLNEAYQHLQKNQKQLLAAEHMASLGRLTAGIAHEMNTPLASISAAMQELKVLVKEYKDSIDHPEVLPEDHRELAQEMENNIFLSLKAADKTTSFIRGIKGQSFNTIGNGVEKYNASQIITDTLKMLEFKFKRSQCNLVTDIDDSVILLGNPRGLSQIVTNLVNNALEASEGKIITVTVRLKAAENNVILIVEDTGPGIPEEILTCIFDPFFTTKQFGESSGLGLGIVKDLVTHFHGTINVKSNNGITRFTLDLPLNGNAD